MADLVKCQKPDCMRKVKVGTDYCCSPCATAAAGRYEIHQHSTGCQERVAERGEYCCWMGTTPPCPQHATIGAS